MNMRQVPSNQNENIRQPERSAEEEVTEGLNPEDVEGLDSDENSWGDYPIDDILIRQESRTVYDVVRRINEKTYVMDPEFQRDFIWPKDKQSKLIESVTMRIPLPVFYMAEDDDGQMVVVDGLQRLSTFQNFLNDELRLKLPDRNELNGRLFSELSPKLQNRVEDCNLIFYNIDSRVPERARLDIFERVNGGVALTRQQMRNCLFMGEATRFLKREAETELFEKATGRSLKRETMRDREFVNRFCAFQLLELDEYRGDMDEYLANVLRRMNMMDSEQLASLSTEFRRGLKNNLTLFEDHAFRKSIRSGDRRSPLNASLWDVMSTGLSLYPNKYVRKSAQSLRDAVQELLLDEDFETAITYGPNDAIKVRYRFKRAKDVFQEVLGANAY